MNGNKACGPDLIPIEVWTTMGEEGIVFLKKELNEMLKLNFSQYPSIHINYIISHCTTLWYNHNIWHGT